MDLKKVWFYKLKIHLIANPSLLLTVRCAIVRSLFQTLSTLFILLSVTSCNQKGGTIVDSLVGIKGSLLDGEGVGNDSLSFSPNPLDFGNVAVGASTSVSTISVTNTGKVALKILALNLPTENADLTLATDGTCSIGSDLDVNSACTLRVQYTPSVAGKFQSKIGFDFAPQPIFRACSQIKPMLLETRWRHLSLMVFRVSSRAKLVLLE